MCQGVRVRALWAVVSVRRLLVCLTIDAAACRVRPRVDRARRQVTGDTQTMLTRARGTDSTTLLVTDQVEPSRSDGTLLMGADPHRRRKHASAMTDDGNARHSQHLSAERPRKHPNGRQKHTPRPTPSAARERQRRRRLPRRHLATDASPPTPGTEPRPTRVVLITLFSWRLRFWLLAVWACASLCSFEASSGPAATRVCCHRTLQHPPTER